MIPPFWDIIPIPQANVAKLVDALDLGSSTERFGSSSLPIRTNSSLVQRTSPLYGGRLIACASRDSIGLVRSEVSR